MKPTLPEFATEVGLRIEESDDFYTLVTPTGTTLWVASKENWTERRIALNELCVAYAAGFWAGRVDGRRAAR